MSHKAGYVGKTPQSGKRQKRLEAALTKALSFMLQVYRVGFEVGFLEAKRQTTTGSGPAVSAETKHRKRSGTHRTAGNK